MRRERFGWILGLSAALLAHPLFAMPVFPPATSRTSASIVPVEFWCSPGFEPRGGSCLATLSRDEILIYDQDDVVPRPHRRLGRHRLRALY